MACRALVIAGGAWVLAAVPAGGARASAGGTFTTIEVPGSVATFAFGINRSGLIVGTYLRAGAFHGFADQSGTFTTIRVPGASATFAGGVNDHGEIVGSYRRGGVVHGFADHRGAVTTIDVPGAAFTTATGVSDKGEVVGTYASRTGPDHGFADRGGAFTTIDVPGAIFTFANGVSDKGKIVGQYVNPPVVTSLGFEFTPAGKPARPALAGLRRAAHPVSVPSALTVAGGWALPGQVICLQPSSGRCWEVAQGTGTSNRCRPARCHGEPARPGIWTAARQ